MDRKVRLKPPSGGDRRSASGTAAGVLAFMPRSRLLRSVDGWVRRAPRGFVRGEREERVFEVLRHDLHVMRRRRGQQVPRDRIGIRRLDQDTLAADLDRADAGQARQRSLIGFGQAGPDRSAAREVADLGCRPVCHDPPLPEQDDPVRVGVGLLEVVGGEQHRAAAFRIAADGGPEVTPALDVHPRRGLVEGHQRRVRQQCQGEPEALLLSAGAFPHKSIGEVADPRPVEHLVHGSRFGIDRSGQANGLPHGEVLEQAARLHDGRHETPRDGRGRRHPEHLDSPLIGLTEAQDHVDRGGLAGSVRAKERGDLTELEVKIDAVDGVHGAEAPMHVLQVDGGDRCLGRDHPGILRGFVEHRLESPQPNVKQYASTPASRNSISKVRSPIGPGWRISW